ncbi:MFS transporter [Cytophagales bacterium LB-30]|uniref:MFS transporter n=1 Tax=Shiella aurantiaca TaxID=3058365 RepID=A0ABT8F8Y9_9BACT|nr:MFS transporter [Shiella aurantiaca]MDN4166853.1 MFS transporter [Shiella aurantiaca]
MKAVFTLYKNAFGGLSTPAWMLALVMLVNRSGTMVIPFLSIYLTGELGFSIQQAGYILSIFGLGSMVGSYLGGYLSDKIGHFWVQCSSLVLSGLLFFWVVQVRSFHWLGLSIFILSIIAESLRPANISSVASYAKPENITRAFSLNRMAINLGFSIGPALGGLLAGISFKWLFIADGFTCIGAGLLFFLYFRTRKGHEAHKSKEALTQQELRKPHKDRLFLAFVLLATSYAVVFFQLFGTLPLYYREVYALSEGKIGGLLGINGFVIFAFEMILVYLIGQRFRSHVLIIAGVLLNGFGFVFLNLMPGPMWLIPGMVMLSFAEILVLPFLSTLVVARAGTRNRGAYMGVYTLSFSLAHVLAPYLGTHLVANYGFDTLWWASGALSIFTALGMWVVVRKME